MLEKWMYSSVIRQKGESRTGCFKKTKHVKFSEKTNISENLTCFVFLKHLFWDSPFCFITDVLSDIMLWYARAMLILWLYLKSYWNNHEFLLYLIFSFNFFLQSKKIYIFIREVKYNVKVLVSIELYLFRS